MRKLVFSKEKEKNEKRMQKWFAIIIGLVMALSTAGFAINFVTSEKVSYKGLKFSRTDSGWQPRGLGISTTYLPGDVENITLNGQFSSQDFNSKVYLIALPYMRSDALEFLQNMPVQNLQQACLPEYENEQFCSELPTKSCEDADPQNVMFVMKESNSTSISYANYCLTIEGQSGDLTMAVDRAIFQAYGIIK